MTPDFNVRPFNPSPAEYEAIVQVYNSDYPNEAGSASQWRHWDEHRDPKRMFSRYVMEHGGEIVGYGFSMRVDPAANKFRFAIYLFPRWRTPDVIDAFYRYIVAQCVQHAPAALICRTMEDHSTKNAWLIENGFEEVMRYPRSILPLVGFDATLFSDVEARIAAAGIEIISVAELATREPDWQRRVYELEMLLTQDVPMPTAFHPPPFDLYVQREFNDPDFMPQWWVVAVNSDQLVGTSCVFKLGGGLETVETGLTGVHRDYRRQGLATALKCQVMKRVQEQGVRRIITYNEANNPMYQLNLRLGFQPQPQEIDWQKSPPYD